MLSNVVQESAIDCGVGFRPVRTQLSRAAMEVAYSDALRSSCSDSVVNVWTR
ncbi:hypothetical protein [Saccharothrix luteola]|uniref:hypothetical protein n=1 Tax=Saccharothrix luteola TaxID=2893018 RepID=UPI001E5CC904|nr:hypothetical protein [Saccharothrix luteola]MCC8243078.1 hypothetical protein [Saccharothrix luteola]